MEADYLGAAWRRLSPSFDSAGAIPALLEALAAEVVAGGARRLPPDAVAALAAMPAEAGTTENSSSSLFERVVLRLDPGCLDFDAAVRACGGGGAGGRNNNKKCLVALAGVFVRLLGDAATPGAAFLVDALLAAADSSSKSDGGGGGGGFAATRRMLAFLRACFRGEPFPPRSSSALSLPPLDPGRADRVRASALGFLLHGTPEAASDALSAAGGGALLPPKGGDGSKNHICLDESSLPGPHPVLRLAFSLGCAREAVSALRDALRSWDALEEEICDAARVPRPRRAGGGGGGGKGKEEGDGDGEEEGEARSAAQSVADALAALLEETPSPRLDASASAASLGLIADLVSESRATASAALLEAALRQVALGGGTGGATTTTMTTTREPPERSRDRDAREDLFVRLLSAAVSLYGPSSSSTSAAALESKKKKKEKEEREEKPAAPPLDLAAIRTLARSAGFARAEAAALDAAGDVGGALDVLLALSSSSSSSFRIFEYADRVLEEAAAEAKASSSSSSPSPANRKRWLQLRAAVVERAPALAAADGGAAARLVARHFPEDHAAVMSALSGDEALAFAYLRGAYAAAAARVSPGGGGGGEGGEGGSSDINDDSSATATAASRAAAARLLADPRAGDAYVRLLCSRDPGGVLPFLKSRAAYSAEAALKSARVAGVADAQAFLLERLGDVAGAASILAAALMGAGEALLSEEAAAGEGRLRQLQQEEPSYQALRRPRPLSPREALLSALDDALGLCRRGGADLPPAAAAALWMTAIDALADLLRRAGSGGGGSEGGEGKGKGKGTTRRARSGAAASLLASALDAAVAAAASSVPLRHIGERLLERHGAAPLREFRATLSGVLAGGRREAALAAAAARLSSADAAVAEGAARAAAVRASSSRPENGERESEEAVVVVFDPDERRGRRQRRQQRKTRASREGVGGGGGTPLGLTLAPAGERFLLGETAARSFSARGGEQGDDGDDDGPGSPLSRGGVDVGYLMLHDVSLHDGVF